jgi:opacity protein-like surface antigen
MLLLLRKPFVKGDSMHMRMWFVLIASFLTCLTFSTPVRAQGFISPFIGYDFGGDSGCPDVNDCEDKKLNAGVAVGAMGSVLGFEEEFAYAKDFFGTTPAFDSSVFTLMSNLMLVPKIGPVRPYALAGLGLIKTHVEFTTASLLTVDDNHFGWDVGGGLMILVADHVGVRGNLRYFHAFEDLEVLGFTLGDAKLDFGRLSGALVLKF